MAPDSVNNKARSGEGAYVKACSERRFRQLAHKHHVKMISAHANEYTVSKQLDVHKLARMPLQATFFGDWVGNTELVAKFASEFALHKEYCHLLPYSYS
jgi:hypothetical protein